MKSIIRAFYIVFFATLGVQADGAVVHVDAGEGFEERLQEALILSEPGTTIAVGPGRYDMMGGLSIDVANLTLKGAGKDATVFNFKGQASGSEGLLITSNGVRVEGFAVEDTPGDGIKSKGVDTVSFIDLRVEWTDGPKATNGAYGVYPVASKNVLIDGVTVRGASDAGIYVGQSQQIVVRNSLAEYNVAGIEIENCYFADVHDNVTTHNTGGILVFDLPNLPQMGGHSVRLYRNKSVDNDTPNFAPPGNIVATVPMGTGIMVMANRETEVFENELGGNASVNILLVAYPRDYNDDSYNPLPRAVYVHDNIHGRAGYAPDKDVKVLIESRTGLPVPNIVWDGAVNGFWAAFFGPDDNDAIYIDEKEGTTFANLQFVKDMILPWDVSPDTDIENYKGSFPSRPAVLLPQDKAE